MPVILAALGPLFGKLLDWLPTIGAYFKGRSDGAAAVTDAAQIQVAEIIAAERKAAASAPHTVGEVMSVLNKGEF